MDIASDPTSNVTPSCFATTGSSRSRAAARPATATGTTSGSSTAKYRPPHSAEPPSRYWVASVPTAAMAAIATRARPAPVPHAAAPPHGQPDPDEREGHEQPGHRGRRDHHHPGDAERREEQRRRPQEAEVRVAAQQLPHGDDGAERRRQEQERRGGIVDGIRREPGLHEAGPAIAEERPHPSCDAEHRARTGRSHDGRQRRSLGQPDRTRPRGASRPRWPAQAVERVRHARSTATARSPAARNATSVRSPKATARQNPLSPLQSGHRRASPGPQGRQHGEPGSGGGQAVGDHPQPVEEERAQQRPAPRTSRAPCRAASGGPAGPPPRPPPPCRAPTGRPSP